MASPSTGPTITVVVIKKLPQAWLALALFMIALGITLFSLAMANFPLTLVASAARESLILRDTPDFARPAPSAATLYVWNYTSISGSSIRLQQSSYQLSLQTVRYNISFRDDDTVVQYWSRNEWHVDGASIDAFRTDVIVQPSFMHFTRLVMTRTRTIASVLRQMLNGTQGAPPITDLTTRCSISSIFYSQFAATFQVSDRIIDFFQGVDRRDPDLADRFTDCGVTRDNVPSVASLLHSLSLIGYRQMPGGTDAEIARTTPAAVFATFMPNQTTDASAYRDGDYTEKFTGRGNIANLKRYRRYKGAAVVKQPDWQGPEPVEGLRDFQGDTFREQPNVQLRIFTPTTMRMETWRTDESVDLYGLSLARFKRRPETFLNADAWAPNARFYMHGPSGVFNMNPSQTGAPVYISQPHFLAGDPVLFNSLRGLAPDANAHESFLDFEPNLGVALRAQQRFQMNLRLDKGMVADPLLVRGDHAFLPLWWIEIGGSAGAATAETMKKKLVGAVQVCFLIRLIFSMAALPLFCYGLGIAKESIVFIRKN